MAIGPYPLSIGFQLRQIPRSCACGNDDILGCECRYIAIFRNGNRRGGLQHAVTHMDVDLILLHQMGDALVELARHTTRTFDNGIQIGGDLFRFQAIIARMLHIMIDFRRTQQRFGRNTAPVEADAAQVFALNDGGFQT